MIDSFLPLLLLIAFSMYPNNVAFILLAIAPMLLSKLPFFDAFGISATVLVVAIILAASVAHTFLSFIPAKLIYLLT
jgi:hypothetical protein